MPLALRDVPSLPFSHCSFVLEELKSMPPSEDSSDHKARCLWFLDALIKFSFQKVIKKKRELITGASLCPAYLSAVDWGLYCN